MSPVNKDKSAVNLSGGITFLYHSQVSLYPLEIDEGEDEKKSNHLDKSSKYGWEVENVCRCRCIFNLEGWPHLFFKIYIKELNLIDKSRRQNKWWNSCLEGRPLEKVND